MWILYILVIGAQGQSYISPPISQFKSHAECLSGGEAVGFRLEKQRNVAAYTLCTQFPVNGKKAGA